MAAQLPFGRYVLSGIDSKRLSVRIDRVDVELVCSRFSAANNDSVDPVETGRHRPCAHGHGNSSENVIARGLTPLTAAPFRKRVDQRQIQRRVWCQVPSS
ncbi:hypothetical protein PF005_g24837 [Phytophthora fragariae]|uniref:Uncharacterized protein n=1 Tax=Phytophthora fragariae TaxID=53985 RepID=A0A6A3RI14_9STRA|nr:hypothetical protein PF003_g27801 [Phytophthora fragariae]KAE8930907.1 hypothetical protein PF009_g19018 [Phytophthora fragariae]KAE8994306.1 hypothetical protein PF011_g16776 [Phytophthora fragariae]KAE9093883.1 hypothetical protein PF007_g17960 [Phytophthora fragariae]KAE9094578.1 hypothetical protein PF010_g17045 [Phytophthora fragariae]